MYLGQRSKNLEQLHSIFFDGIPDFIAEFLETKELLRLNNICQYGGLSYTKIGLYSEYNSRLDHSLGVALIMWNFTKDKTQTIAALLHDVSHTAFSHTGEAVLAGGKLSEEEILNIVGRSKSLTGLLEKLNIPLVDIDVPAKYPLLDNETPKLCADRLEYTLHDGLLNRNINIEEIADLYKDIYVTQNEEGQPEFAFHHLEYADKIASLSVKNSYKRHSVYCVEKYLSRLLATMISKEILTPNDLFVYDDKQVFEIAHRTKDIEINEILESVRNLHSFPSYSDHIIPGRFCIPVNVKKRYITPLVSVNQMLTRVSNSDTQQYVNDPISKYQYI